MSDQESPVAAQPPVVKAAAMLVHWPTGPVACCDEHGAQLVALGDFLGTHIVATTLTEPAECVNCANEATQGVKP